jgi:multiple sugar transport system ATP-binding protein
MASVRFENASRLYPGSDKPAVDNFNLDIENGEFMVLVGPSGCGKSTCLRMLAGLEEVTTGSIYIGDTDVSNMEPKDRDIAMVFQNYALYPHMSVAENMGFALKMAGVDKAEREKRVQEAAELLGLNDFLHRKPKAMSGGQRQRVAMGRAIVRQPQVFCMDEPLSNLDAKLRVTTRTQIAALQQRLDVTTVYVTHDQVEALTMGDRVAVMNFGILQQCDTPLRLYDAPANLFVAGFIGSPAMNLFEGKLGESGVTVSGGSIPVAVDASERSAAQTEAVTVGVRPESLRIAEENEEGVEITVRMVEELGADAYVFGTVAATEDADVTHQADVIIRIEGRRAPQKGSHIKVTSDPERTHVFDTATGERVGHVFDRSTGGR